MRTSSTAFVVAAGIILAACTAGPSPVTGAPARDQVFAAERAFADSMARRDLAAFATFVDDEAVFFSGSKALRGKQQVIDPYLKTKLEMIHRVADESKTIIRRIREPFEVADEGLVNISVCLAQALSSFQPGPGIEVVERYQHDLPPVLADRKKLVEAFCHIIGNALEAMEEKGQLLLSTRRRLDGLVEAVISDDGPGIAPEIHDHLFELSVTTKTDKGGLGLGLWWTRMYITRRGGQVKLHSTPGRGTVVSIRLPASQEATL